MNIWEGPQENVYIRIKISLFMFLFTIGTKVIFGIYALHHNASVWGDDVEVCALMDEGWDHILYSAQCHLMEADRIHCTFAICLTPILCN